MKMTTVPELRLYVACTRDFADPALCRAFLSVLDSFGPEWLPDRFGSAEPLKGRYREKGKGGVCAAWATPPRPGSAGGDLLYRTTKTLDARGWVYWRRGARHDVNFVNVAVPIRTADPALGGRLVDLGERLMAALGGVYARVCDSVDYDAQHKLRTASGFQYVGQRVSAGLPGIYWANLFGSELVRLVGNDRFEKCPASRKARTADGGWVLFSSISPRDEVGEETRALRAAMREAIGSCLFFNIADPTAAVTPLPFDRAAILGSG